MMNAAKRALESAAELVFPPRCVLCGAVRPMNGTVCESCVAAEQALRLRGDDRDCDDGTRSYCNLDGVCASFEYSGAAADSVAELKFHGGRYLAREMAQFISKDVASFFLGCEFDVTVAVPSYRSKNRHAGLVAKYTASLLGVRFLPRGLVKVRKTEKQHLLSAERRAQNLIDAFAVPQPGNVKGKTVLIIDDVTTSGNTLNECAAALKKAGALEVYAAAFCATPKLLDGNQNPNGS